MGSKLFIFGSALLLTGFISCNTSRPPDSSSAPPVNGTTFDSSAQISEYIVAISEDKSGNLWFGTMSDGAVRFDGTQLKYFTTADGVVENTVANIAQDTSGAMWFGTHNGATRMRGNVFTTFGAKEGLHGAGCKFLVDRSGQLWAGTNHGVFQFNGTSFVEFDLPEPTVGEVSYKWELGKVWDLKQDSKGNTWFARDGYGACRYDGKTFTHFSKADGLCSNNVARITEDVNGNIWFGCITSDLPKPVQEGGACMYDGKTIRQFSDQPGLTANDVYSVYADKSGNVWIAALGQGVYRYDGKTFTLITESNRKDLITNFGLQSVLEDRKGTLWFGFSGGLFRIKENRFINVTRGGPWK